MLAILLPLLGPIDFDFVPQVQTGEISMTVTYPPGTPICRRPRNTSTQLEDAIMKIDGIKSVSSTVGRKPQGWSIAIGDNYARLNAQTLPERRHDTYKIIDQNSQARLSRCRAATFRSPATTAAARARRSSTRSPGPKTRSRPAAEKVAQFLRNTPGSVNVADEQ